MEKKSPKVVNPSRFIYAKNNPDAKNKSSSKSEKTVSDQVDYFRRQQKVMNMVSYHSGELKGKDFKSFLMEDGHNATDEEARKRSKEYVKAWKDGSNIYQTVLSFDNNFIDENISLEKLNQKIIKNAIPQYLKKIGFQDMKNMMYNASLHLDSKSGHYHYHICFAEKKPNYKSKSAKKYMKPVYRRRGKIDLEDFNFFKRVVTMEIKREGLLKDKRIELNQEIQDIKDRFNITSENYILKDIDNLYLQDQIDELSELLKEERLGNNKNIKFNSLKNTRIKELTKSITNELYKDMLKDEKESFEKTLSEINNYYSEINKMNNVKELVIESVESKNKREYVDNFVYNAIVNNLAYSKKEKLKKEDLVKEIVRKEYTQKDYIPSKKNNILNHVLKKPAKAQIKKGIYSLKSEMEKATDEFSKSFQVQTYK